MKRMRERSRTTYMESVADRPHLKCEPLIPNGKKWVESGRWPVALSLHLGDLAYSNGRISVM